MPTNDTKKQMVKLADTTIEGNNQIPKSYVHVKPTNKNYLKQSDTSVVGNDHILKSMACTYPWNVKPTTQVNPDRKGKLTES